MESNRVRWEVGAGGVGHKTDRKDPSRRSYTTLDLKDEKKKVMRSQEKCISD